MIEEAIADVSVESAADIYKSETPTEKATDEASPSIPSVRLVQFITPRRIINAIG